MQIEGVATVASQYAPVKFSGSTAKPAKGDFKGVTFSALAGTGDTLSPHAVEVARLFYGPGTLGQKYVSTVLSDSADGLLSRLKAQGRISPSGPRPSDLPSNVSVINGSFIAGLGSPAADGDAARRLDYALSRSSATYVAAAVVNTSDRAGDNLFWSCRNAIAVRGSTQVDSFDPSAGQLDRTHGDLWDVGAPSDATARVSSAATALIGEATRKKWTDATAPQVVKSLLLTGANRGTTDGIISPWQQDTLNGMDADAGAGRLDYAASRSILLAGSVKGSAVAKGRVDKSAKVGKSASGYSLLNNLDKGSRTAVMFTTAADIPGLTVTLDWMSQFRLPGGQFNSTASGTFVPNLSLSIVPVKKDAKGYALGAALYTSDVRDDNLERLLINQSLATGTYALVVSNNSSVSVTAGLSFLAATEVTVSGSVAPLVPDSAPFRPSAAWHPGSTLVPEPSVLIASLPLLLRRRQKKEGADSW